LSQSPVFSPATTLTSGAFLEKIRSLRPRIAVFDCDGTLWSNNSGEDFFYWSMEQGMVSPEVVAWITTRYDDYRGGLVAEDVMCGEMTTMYAGLRVSELEAKAREFFAAKVEPNIFPEMLELTRGLVEDGCELWAVSSTNEWVVREGIRQFGIPADHVLAATSDCMNGIAGEKLTRMPTGPGKAQAITEIIARPVDAVFGNSVHDAAMLKLARYPFVVNPTPELAALAEQERWIVYWPEAVRQTRK